MQFRSLVFLGALCACSSSTRGGFDNPSDGGGGFVTKPAEDAATDDCTDAAKLVYVLSENRELYSFAPDKGQFKKIGMLDCSANGQNANSMAIDRAGTAWVNYADGSLFKVSTTDAKCAATPFQKNQHGFGTFGMAFSTNSATSKEETLYIANVAQGAGSQFAKIDLTTFTVVPIGDYSGALAGMGAELTGTGDGRLFGFFTTLPNATFAQIDSATGKTSGDKDLAGVSTGTAWAFSFWGGDFWFYTSSGLPSKVTRLKASGDNSLSTAVADVGGFRIVGAGVSTCAPTTPPR